MSSKRWISFPLIVLIVVGASYFGGIRVAHPQSGLKNSLGSAKSGLALYRANSNFFKGDLVVVNTGDNRLDPALAKVSNIAEDSIDIQSGTQIQRVDSKAIKGKLLIVFPFLGYFFNLF